MNFDTIFDRVIGHEAGFTDNPADPGNWTGGKVNSGVLKGTKFGIAANTYPDLDIKHLNVDQARAIYFEDWYIANNINLFRPAMQFQMFDAAFNHGMRNASKIFQRAVNAEDDGYIGPRTMKASADYSENDLLLRFIAYRIRFFVGLSTFDTFGKGWMNRIAGNLLFAAVDNDS